MFLLSMRIGKNIYNRPPKHFAHLIAPWVTSFAEMEAILPNLGITGSFDQPSELASSFLVLEEIFCRHGMCDQ